MSRSRLALLVALLLAPLAGCVGPEDANTGPTPTTPTPTTPAPTTPTPGAGEPEAPREFEPADICDVTPEAPVNPTGDFFNASFEAGVDGFVGDCALPPLVEGGGPAEWNVTRTDALAAEGDWSVRLGIPGAGANGTVWVERVVKVNVSRATYEVDLSFRMRGDGEAVAFIGLRSPYRIEHFTPNSDGSTSIPGALHLRTALESDEWTSYAVSGEVTTSSQGLLFVAVGFTRTSEGPAEAYLDDVRFAASGPL